MPEPLFQDPQLAARVAAEVNAWEMIRLLGIEVEFPSNDRVRAKVPRVLAFQRGGLPGSGSGAVNGGVLAALFDLVLGMTGLVRNHPAPTATIQLSMNFLRPVVGDEVVAEAWIERGGRSLLFSVAQVLDQHGQICATATGIVRLLDAQPATR